MNLITQSKDVQLYGWIHSDICNVPLYLVPSFRKQIKLTKVKPSFYLLNKDAETKTVFKSFEVQILVNRLRPNPLVLLAHNISLEKGALAR